MTTPGNDQIVTGWSGTVETQLWPQLAEAAVAVAGDRAAESILRGR